MVALAKPIRHHPIVVWQKICFRFPILFELRAGAFPTRTGSSRQLAHRFYGCPEATFGLTYSDASSRRSGEELLVA